jgi:hypothetical protein
VWCAAGKGTEEWKIVVCFLLRLLLFWGVPAVYLTAVIAANWLQSGTSAWKLTDSVAKHIKGAADAVDVPVKLLLVPVLYERTYKWLSKQ